MRPLRATQVLAAVAALAACSTPPTGAAVDRTSTSSLPRSTAGPATAGPAPSAPASPAPASPAPPPAAGPARSAPTESAPASTDRAPASTAPTTAVATTVPVPASTTPPTVAGDFTATIGPAPGERMSASWREGCPVPLNDLRLLTVTHRGFDGSVRTGELVVHADWAEPLTGVFRRLFEVGFPIERMELVDVYGADDDASMAANNTSAFNCRPVTGGTGWSEHAYGWAIDLNPVQNPYLTRRGTVLPPTGSAFLDRADLRPGMVTDEVVAAFAAIGWGWGGTWSDPVDYQHFSAGGG